MDFDYVETYNTVVPNFPLLSKKYAHRKIRNPVFIILIHKVVHYKYQNESLSRQL